METIAITEAQSRMLYHALTAKPLDVMKEILTSEDSPAWMRVTYKIVHPIGEAARFFVRSIKRLVILVKTKSKNVSNVDMRFQQKLTKIQYNQLLDDLQAGIKVSLSRLEALSISHELADSCIQAKDTVRKLEQMVKVTNLPLLETTNVMGLSVQTIVNSEPLILKIVKFAMLVFASEDPEEIELITATYKWKSDELKADYIAKIQSAKTIEDFWKRS